MSPGWMRRLFNIYPPMRCAGIRVTHIADDWRYLRVQMRLRWYNRNYVGTHFGGSLFAMTDPFLMIMAMKNLGRGYTVWDRAAEIEFVAPGRGTVATEFRLSEADLDEMRARTAAGERYLPWFTLEVRDEEERVVARVRKQLYVRRTPEEAGRAAAPPGDVKGEGRAPNRQART
jgi:acyl-coenzyme A thioesterase PaaI-like protein